MDKSVNLKGKLRPEKSILQEKNARREDRALPKNSAPRENSEPQNLTDEEQRAVKALSDSKWFEKGTILVKEGEVVRKSFFIKEGCVRQYYLMDGDEKTTFFYTENQAIPSANTIATRNPSKFYLECVENTHLMVTTIEQEQEIYERFPRFQALCRIETERQLAEHQDMFAKYMTSSPEERYRNVMKNRPDLLNRVPQYQVASYLGVKPESLSRIRKRIASKA